MDVNDIGVSAVRRALAARSPDTDHAVVIVAVDSTTAEGAPTVHDGATVGTLGTALVGDIVAFTARSTGAAEVVARRRNPLNGSAIVDITTTVATGPKIAVMNHGLHYVGSAVDLTVLR